jgi:uncharacterized protein
MTASRAKSLSSLNFRGRLTLLAIVMPLWTLGTTPVLQAQQTVWSAQPSTHSVSEERKFQHDGVTLSGTLIRPIGIEKAPLVIVFHGASSPLRSEALYDHLRRMLPSLGIAVFTYDRRGTGRSGGSTKGNSFDLLADDGIAAAEMLAADPHIDASRIGFWGLSQGGWLSLLAASKYKRAAFAVSISAPMVTPDVQMNFAVTNILRIKGVSQEDIDLAIAARTAVDQFERGQLDRASAQARLDRVIDKPWFDLIYMDKTFSDPDKSGWAKEIRHDPLSSIGTVTVPVLVIYGSTDPWVPAANSVERLASISRERANFKTVVIDGADHAMMTTLTPEQQIDPAGFATQAPNSAEYFGRLAAWLQKQGIAQ